MNNTAIIIPTRLAASRLSNKPLAVINALPMIVQVLHRAIEAKIGKVFVASHDIEIIDIVKKNGGQAILTRNDHLNGTSRVFEAFTKLKDDNVDLIINLQGDMPNIKPSSITKLEKLMRKNNCPIGTLASSLNKEELYDENVVKVEVAEELKKDSFLEAKDFFRMKKDLKNKKVYHHIGIYGYNNEVLKEYVNLKRTKLELARDLEQMRFMENNKKINVGYCDSNPLSVDTLADLKRVEKEKNQI